MYLLYFLALIITTQETLYALAGFSGAFLFLMRALVDISSPLILTFFIAHRSLQARAFPLSGIRYERVFAFFLFYSILISMASMHANFVTDISEILVLNRFVFLAMAIPFIVNSEAKIERMLRFLWYLILLQAGIGLVQAIGGGPVVRFFLPNDYGNILTGAERSFTSNRDLGRQMLIGSMGDFISFGYMMFFGIIMLISRGKRGFGAMVLLTVFLVLTFLSGSRTIFLAAFVVVILHIFARARMIWRALIVLFLLAVAPFAVFLVLQKGAGVEFEYTSFFSLFSPQIIDVLMNQRLGHLLLYLPTLFGDPVIVTGFSPDRQLAADYVNANFSEVLPYVYRANFYDTLEDFYPAALITYYGLIGSAIFYFAQYRIFASAWADRTSTNPIVARVAKQVFLGMIVVNLLSLGNQSFENRGLSFMVWLSVGLYASVRNIRSRDGQAQAHRSDVGFPSSLAPSAE